MRFQYEQLTRKNQDSLVGFCPLSLDRMDVKLLNHTCKKAYKRPQTQIVSVYLLNFISHCGGHRLRTWTSEDESYSVWFSEYQYGTQITQTFYSYLKNHLVLQCITYQFVRKTVR